MVTEFHNAEARPSVGDPGRTFVYSWSVRDIYLLDVLFEGLGRLEARPGETAAEAASRILESERRPGRVIVHIDNSVPADFIGSLAELGDTLNRQRIEVWNAC